MKYIINATQAAEIMSARRKNKDKFADKRLEALELRTQGKKDREIAEITGFHKNHVSYLVVKYLNEGIDAIVNNNFGGNNRNISFEDEQKMLAEFEEKALQGQIVSTRDIKSKYDELIGHECGSGTIYKLLERHGWRKVMPRSKHPNKASDEAIEASKKLTTHITN